MTKNKVLLITYDFFPDNSPNTYRWLNVLKEWKKNRDIEIYVVASKQDSFLHYEEAHGIKIFRTGDSWFNKIKGKLLRVSNKKEKAAAEATNIVYKESLIRKVYNLTWKKIYFPDFAFLWQKSAYKQAQKLIREENIKNVITVSWPFSGHVVGSKLKENNDIFWIADTIDPFYLSKAVNNNFLYNSLNYKYEKKILGRADVVTVLTDKLKNKYASLYPAIAEKIVVNHNIFIPYNIDFINNYKDSNKIKLVFVGTLTPITRSPKKVLDFFASLLEYNDLQDKLELYFYGNVEQCSLIFNEYSDLLEKKIFVKGFVTRETIPNILNEADVLINVGNNNEYQEPSKILEYVYLKKPILNICTIKNDTAKEMLETYPMFFNVEADEITCKIRLEEFRTFLLSSARSILSNNDVEVRIKEYLISEVEQKYFKLLKQENE